MGSYIISEIDKQQYCISNGAFRRHLLANNIDYQEYYEKYITYVKVLCPYCGQPRKLNHKTLVYSKTCCGKECISKDIKAIWEARPASVKNDIALKKSKTRLAIPSEEKHRIETSKKTTCMKKYGVQHPMHLQTTKDKVKATVMSLYGVDNPAQSPEIKAKQVTTLLSRYGVTIPMHNTEIKNKVSTKLRQLYHGSFINIVDNKDAIREAYTTDGISGVMKLTDTSKSFSYKLLGKYDIALIKQKHSIFEQEVITYIKSVYTGTIILGNKSILGGKELDIYLPELNLAIECNGTFWHSESNGRTQFYHVSKVMACKAQNIHLMHIWDYQWYNNIDIIKSMLLHKMGKSTTIYARKCKIVSIDQKTAKSFTQSNHIQGCVPSSINYGLEYNGRLVAVMTFGKSRYRKDTAYEIFRFCNILNNSVVGAATRLYNHFLKIHEPDIVVSYASKEYSLGGLYSKLGMMLVNETVPGYRYTNDYVTLHNRLKFQKHKLGTLLATFDDALSEKENMLNNGYDRIWDCGQYVYEYKKYAL